MAKLYFHYSSMNAGKSTALLQANHNYGERGMSTMLFTAKLDDRDGVGVIRSRIGIEHDALVFAKADDLLETVREDFVRTARAKGLSRNAALWRHAVRNALIPVVTILGLQLSFLLAGTIIIENVFYLPGLGRLLFQAIAQRDLVVVKNIVILLAVTVVIVNFLVDMFYLALDPRLRDGTHE